VHCPPGGFERCPRPARKALHRQYGEILLGCGAPSALAARHLLQAAHPGDPTSLAGLDRASARTLRQSPQTAADLAVRALELTPPADQDALPRLVAAAETLTAAGRLEQAARIVHDALGRPLPPIQEARLRCVLSSVLCTSGQAQDAVAKASIVLAQPHLPGELVGQAIIARLQALAGGPTDPGADRLADTALASAGQSGDQVTAAARVRCAMTSWDNAGSARPWSSCVTPRVVAPQQPSTSRAGPP
jgi:hypothetical protein